MTNAIPKPEHTACVMCDLNVWMHADLADIPESH